MSPKFAVGPRGPETPLPPQEGQPVPEAPPREQPPAPGPEVETEKPASQAAEELIIEEPPKKEEIQMPGQEISPPKEVNVDIGDLEAPVNTMDQAARLQEKINAPRG